MQAPLIPEDVLFSDLDRDVRARLRTLSKENAENVGLHLVMAGRLLDTDPELAYEHAQAAVQRAGRVDVVREAAGLAAYRTGRFAEALRELRTVRRLNGSSEHLAVMADCERGLGRPERALALADSPEAAELPADVQIELAMVVSGARLDLGEPEAAVAVLASPDVRAATGPVAARVAQARATALEAAGRPEAAAAELAAFSPDELAQAAGDVVEDEDDIVAFDLEDESDQHTDQVGDDDSELASDTVAEEIDDEETEDSGDEPEDLGGSSAAGMSGASHDAGTAAVVDDEDEA
ncbi:tetratricopeptide repeat protein [soil metagenome]